MPADKEASCIIGRGGQAIKEIQVARPSKRSKRFYPGTHLQLAGWNEEVSSVLRFWMCPTLVTSHQRQQMKPTGFQRDATSRSFSLAEYGPDWIY